MRPWGFNTFVFIVASALAVPVARAADSCGGGCPVLPKNSRAVSAIAMPRPAAPAPLLVATLAKAKKKRLLAVEAQMTTSFLTPGLPSTLGLSVDANGIPLEPGGAAFPTIVDCGGGAGLPFGPPSFACTVSGTWWLDIDAFPVLTTSPPPPLTVTLSGGEAFPGAVGAPINVSMTVRMEKK